MKTFKKLESNWKQGLRETEFKYIEWIIRNEKYELFIEHVKCWHKKTQPTNVDCV